MKAIMQEKYGTPDVLQLREIDKPQPKAGEVLIKVHVASINAADWHLLTADIFLVRFMKGLFKPKPNILGSDVAGKVEAIGADITQFKVGDEVFGDIFLQGSGSLAEYALAPESALTLKPSKLSSEEAAAAPLAAITALQGLRDEGQIRSGQKVLIQGASGGVGTFAVQIAKSFGAEVTAVCSPRNVEMVRSLGADHVIDYTKEDFTKSVVRYDLILAANGYHPIAAYKRTLTPQGIYVMAGGKFKQMFEAMLLGPLMSEKNGRKLKLLSAKSNQKDLLTIKKLLETSRIKSVIDKRYPLQEAAEALRYLGAGHARGKVVINISE